MSLRKKLIIMFFVILLSIAIYTFSSLGGLQSLSSSVLDDSRTDEEIQAAIHEVELEITAKNESIVVLKAELESTDTENRSAKETEIENLDEAIKDLEEEKTELASILVTRAEEWGKKEKEIAEIAELEAQMNDLQVQIDAMTQEKKQLDSDIASAIKLLNAEGEKQIKAYNAVDIGKAALYDLEKKFEPLKAQYDTLKSRIAEINRLSESNLGQIAGIDRSVVEKKTVKDTNIKMIAEKNKEKVSNTTLIATKTTAMNSNANLLTQKNASKAANIASITTATQQKQSNTESINQKTNTKNNNVSRIAQMSKEKEANLGLISAKTKEKEVQQQKLYTLERALTGDRKSTKYKQAEKLVNDQKAVVTKITAEITTLMFRNSQMGSEITTLTNNNAWLSGEIKGLIAANATLDTEIVRLGNVGTQLDTEIAGLTKVVNVLVGEIADLGVRNTTLTKEVDQLTKENTSIDADVVVQTKSKTQLVSTNTTLSTELTAKKNSVAAMEKSTADYQKQSAQISVQKETIEKAEKTLEETNKIVAQKQGEIGEMYEESARKVEPKEKMEMKQQSLSDRVVALGGSPLSSRVKELSSTKKTAEKITWQEDGRKYVGDYCPLSIFDIATQDTINNAVKNMSDEAMLDYITGDYPGVKITLYDWAYWSDGQQGGSKCLACANGSYKQGNCRLCPSGQVRTASGCHDPAELKQAEALLAEEKTDTCIDKSPADNKDDKTGKFCCPDIDGDNINDKNADLACRTKCAICEYNKSEPQFKEACEKLVGSNKDWLMVSDEEASEPIESSAPGRSIANPFLKCRTSARSFYYVDIVHSTCANNFGKAAKQAGFAIDALSSWGIDWKTTAGESIKILDFGCHSLGGTYVPGTQADTNFSKAMTKAIPFQGSLLMGGNQTFGDTALQSNNPGFTFFKGTPSTGKSNGHYFAACPDASRGCWAPDASKPNQELILCNDTKNPESYYCKPNIPADLHTFRNGIQLYLGTWKASETVGTIAAN